MLTIVRRIALIIGTLALLFLPSLSVKAETITSINLIGDSWINRAPMQQARISIGVATVNGKFYAIGGNTGYSISSINEEYDPTTDTWTYKTQMPTPRYSFGIAVYQDKIYCMGGKADGFSAVRTNEVYDPTTDTWQTLKPIPTARMDVQANVVNGKIYLMGGKVSDQSDYNNTVFSLNEEYNPLTDTWTTKAPMAQAVALYASGVVNNKIYAITQMLNMIYDAQNDSWSQGEPPPNRDISIGGVTTGVFAPQRIYVFGASKVQNYDPKVDNWANSASIPTERHYAGITVLNDKIYVIGGFVIQPPKDPKSQFPLYFNPQQVYTSINEEYTPIGYGSVPPEILVISPENNTSYDSSTVSLDFTVNKLTNWLGYSLDGQENVTIAGNTTLLDLSAGLHNIIVYANDTFGNIGASETVSFTKDQMPISTVEVGAAAVIVAVVTLGIVFYRKHKHLQQ